MVLTKKEILDGTNNIQEVKIESLGDTVYLRPLSESELMEVDMVEAQGLGVFETTQQGKRDALNKGELNLAKATQASSEAKLKKIELSINNNKNPDSWTVDEIGQLSRKTVDELILKIDEISGVNITNGDVDKFPEN